MNLVIPSPTAPTLSFYRVPPPPAASTYTVFTWDDIEINHTPIYHQYIEQPPNETTETNPQS